MLSDRKKVPDGLVRYLPMSILAEVAEQVTFDILVFLDRWGFRVFILFFYESYQRSSEIVFNV
jgi:hypothetical protein